MIVDRYTRNHVCLLPGEFREALGDEGDGLAHRNLHCLFKVRVEPHDDPMGSALRSWPGKAVLTINWNLPRFPVSMADRSTSPCPWSALASPQRTAPPLHRPASRA